MTHSPLIVALDFSDEKAALSLVDKLSPTQCALKVGSELFTRLGPNFVQTLVTRQFRVFLDLKFHDIPNTVAKACKRAADLGVFMLNVHALGGMKMMESAAEALLSYGEDKPLLIGVTILTSMNEAAFHEIGFQSSLAHQVLHLARLAKSAGLDGVVCSAQEVPDLKKNLSCDFLAVTPGIRLSSDKLDDQVRVVTPRDAQLFGSDYIVVGRSITHHKNPEVAIDEILSTFL